MKLNKHDKRIVRLINTVTSNSEYHSMHKPRHRGKDIKDIFWWDVVYGSIWAKYFRYTMPKIFRTLDKLFPVLRHDCNYDGIKHENSFGHNQNNILYLVKKYKKDSYIKEEILSEMSEFINACLCGTDIKYVFFGIMEMSNPKYSSKLYEKEKSVLLKNSGWKLIETDFEANYSYEYPPHIPRSMYKANGWLFEIPKDMSKDDAEKIFKKIREKRLKEMHINIS